MTKALLALALFVAVPDAKYDSVFQFGYLTQAFHTARTPDAVRLLEPTKQQRSDINRAIQDQQQRSTEITASLGKIRNSGLSIQQLYRAYQAEGELVKAWNDMIMSIMARIIDDNSKFPAFRCVLNRQLLTLGRLETVLRINQVELSSEQFEYMLKQKMRISTAERPGLIALVYRIGAEHLGISSARLKELGGEPYAKAFPGQGGYGATSPLKTYYDDTPLRFISAPVVQAELALTSSQGRKVSMDLARLKKQYSERKAEELTRSSNTPREITQDLHSLHRRQLKEIRALLTDSQKARLNQLLFQFHMRKMNFKWAAFYVGHSTDHSDDELVLLRNRVQGEAFHTLNALSLRDNLRILISLIGRKKALRVCGGQIRLQATTLTPSRGETASKNRVEKKYLAEFNASPQSPRTRRER